MIIGKTPMRSLNFFFFPFYFLKKIIIIINQSPTGTATCQWDPQTVQKFLKDRSLFRNFGDWLLKFSWDPRNIYVLMSLGKFYNYIKMDIIYIYSSMVVN